MIKKVCAGLLLCSVAALAKPTVYTFEDNTLNTWSQYGTWKIEVEKRNHVLSMEDRSQGSFNLCYTKAPSFTDGTLTVKFRANTGHIDQGGGLMWRVQDNDNYYVARFNPLEDNFRFYIVKDSMRIELASANVKLSSGWHTMKIVQKGTHFTAFIDDKQYLEYTDKQLQKAGGVGVWTKADAGTSFDDLMIETQK